MRSSRPEYGKRRGLWAPGDSAAVSSHRHFSLRDLNSLRSAENLSEHESHRDLVVGLVVP
jgi:hypothetical protein